DPRGWRRQHPGAIARHDRTYPPAVRRGGRADLHAAREGQTLRYRDARVRTPRRGGGGAAPGRRDRRLAPRPSPPVPPLVRDRGGVGARDGPRAATPGRHQRTAEVTPPDRTKLGLKPTTTACLFDLDGVLTQTAAVHARAWKEMF